MATQDKVQPTPTAAVAPGLEELDKVLQEMDPQFATELDAVKRVVSAVDVQIESEVDSDADLGASDESPTPERPKIWKAWLARRRVNFVAWLRRTQAAAIVFFKTVPKEVVLYSWANAKIGFQIAKKVISAYLALPRYQKIGILFFAALLFLTITLVKANLRGRWLPTMYPPILSGFSDHADGEFSFNPRTDMIPFFRAFPQDPEIFLFPKIKVNLRRTQEHGNPMGAFEIYAQVDNHETAMEMQTRQVEMHDLIQRVFEEQSYGDLVSDLGKNRLKGLLKKEIDHALTQGWISDIHYKTFILKP